MEPGTYRGFDYTLTGSGIAVLTFNRPERLNGFTHEIKRDLAEMILQLQMDTRVRVIVFTGQGRAFSAGDDISGKPPDFGDTQRLMPPLARGGPAIERLSSLRFRSQDLVWTVRNIDKPTIAAINGVAIQSGLSLALACDFRLAASSARMGSATLRFGYQPDEGGHYLIVELAGVSRALDILLRQRILSAQEAFEAGLVNEVVEPEALQGAAMALAEELASRPQVAVRLLKRSIYSAARLTMEQAMEDIAVRTVVSDFHPDAEDGRASFVEKRQPRFNQWLEQDPGRA